MFDVRFPDGFVCPKCGCREYYYLSTRHTCQCKNCRRQTSVTAGTVMHRTHLPLTIWFWAIYLCATDKRGISAKGLARQLELSYESAWYLLYAYAAFCGDRMLFQPDANGYLEKIIEEKSGTYWVIQVDDSGKPLCIAVYRKDSLISYTVYQYEMIT